MRPVVSLAEERGVIIEPENNTDTWRSWHCQAATGRFHDAPTGIQEYQHHIRAPHVRGGEYIACTEDGIHRENAEESPYSRCPEI